MINIGKYIEIAINWLTEHFARFFDVINDGVGGFIDAFQDGLTWIPFYVMILGLALLAWFKAGKGVGVFTAWVSGWKRCRLWPWYCLLPSSP